MIQDTITAQRNKTYIGQTIITLILLIFSGHTCFAGIIQLTGTLRDFKGYNEPGGHIDFENGEGLFTGVAPGIVADTLGNDNKPVYVGPAGYGGTHGSGPFNQWFNDTPGVNLTTTHTITLDNGLPIQGGIYSFSTPAFFPIDGQLFGNSPGQPHNYGFTYEIAAQFGYNGGEILTFSGDDDVWLFINKKKVIDLGGVHATATQMVNLDAIAAQIGIIPGNNYSFNFFYAERLQSFSTFSMQTSIQLMTPIPVPEPSTSFMLFIGIISFVCVCRFKKSHTTKTPT